MVPGVVTGGILTGTLTELLIYGHTKVTSRNYRRTKANCDVTRVWNKKLHSNTPQRLQPKASWQTAGTLGRAANRRTEPATPASR